MWRLETLNFVTVFTKKRTQFFIGQTLTRLAAQSCMPIAKLKVFTSSKANCRLRNLQWLDDKLHFEGCLNQQKQSDKSVHSNRPIRKYTLGRTIMHCDSNKQFIIQVLLSLIKHQIISLFSKYQSMNHKNNRCFSIQPGSERRMNQITNPKAGFNLK